jgi:hypothetical protein
LTAHGITLPRAVVSTEQIIEPRFQWEVAADAECRHSNGFEGSLSADAAGITVCLFTFSHLSFQQPSEDVFSRHFYALREFALDHKEAGSIFAAID